MFDGPGLLTCRLINQSRILIPCHGSKPYLDLYDFDTDTPLPDPLFAEKVSPRGLLLTARFGIPNPTGEVVDYRYLHFLSRPQGEQESSQTIIIAYGSDKKHIIFAFLDIFASFVKTAERSNIRHQNRIWHTDLFKLDPSFTRLGMIVPSLSDDEISIAVHPTSQNNRSGKQAGDEAETYKFAGHLQPDDVDNTLRVVTVLDNLMVIAFSVSLPLLLVRCLLRTNVFRSKAYDPEDIAYPTNGKLKDIDQLQDIKILYALSYSQPEGAVVS